MPNCACRYASRFPPFDLVGKVLLFDGVAASMPELTPLVEESLNAALPAAEAALKAAAGTAARAAEAQAASAAREMQMQVEGRRVEIAVKQDGKVVGKANAMLNLDRTLRTVFAFARRDQGEIPFAIDTRGVLHNPDPEQRRVLESFGVASLGPAAADGNPVKTTGAVMNPEAALRN